MTTYLHQLDGRIRVKVRGLKSSIEGASHLEESLRRVEGIEGVEANPLTGNVLILFDPKRTNHWAVMAALRQLGWREEDGANNAPTRTPDFRQELAKNVISTVFETAMRGLVAALI